VSWNALAHTDHRILDGGVCVRRTQVEGEGCEVEEVDGDVLVIARGCHDAGRG
jgi:hypothetical protein